MIVKLLEFCRRALPFLLPLFLWRLAVAWINPAGMLAMIPIFYYTFVRRVPWFAPFGVLMCFLIDYSSMTVLYWTSLYCLCYAVVGFQSLVDVSSIGRDGAGAFAIFFAAGAFILGITHVTGVVSFIRLAWTIAWVCAMYVPIVMLLNGGHDD
ncbi:hypothetical protein HDR66_01140 [bacterium]|nr:hypothetical protein [bacterium]